MYVLVSIPFSPLRSVFPVVVSVITGLVTSLLHSCLLCGGRSLAHLSSRLLILITRLVEIAFSIECNRMCCVFSSVLIVLPYSLCVQYIQCIYPVTGNVCCDYIFVKVKKPYNVGTLQGCGNLTTLWEPYNVVRTLNLTTLWEPYNVVGTLQRCGNLARLWEPYKAMGTLQRCGNLTTI